MTDSYSPATLADVARLAGVSKMTASNVINGKAGMSEATRQRVLGAVVNTRPTLCRRKRDAGLDRVHPEPLLRGDLGDRRGEPTGTDAPVAAEREVVDVPGVPGAEGAGQAGQSAIEPVADEVGQRR